MDQKSSVRQVTVEVMEGNPVVLPVNQDVDTTLLNKLFPDLHKRKVSLPIEIERPKPARAVPSKRVWAPIMTISNEDTGPSRKYPCSSSQPKRGPRPKPAELVEVGEGNLRDALNILQDYRKDRVDDSLKKLQCEALRAQIEKDRIMGQYYAKKLQLLNQSN